MMCCLVDFTEREFQELPLVVEGESKEVRYLGHGQVIIRFKPTIYSFSSNRCGVVPGSDTLRLKASRIFVEVLERAGIKHAYREVTDRWVRADLVLQPESDRIPHPFRPHDMTAEEVSRQAIAPPVEVVVKRGLMGTTKHRLKGIAGSRVRASHPLFAGFKLEADGPLPRPEVRFDWRNPLRDSDGRPLADENLDPFADYFIDTAKARQTALRVYEVLSTFLDTKDIVVNDLCLFVAEDGETVFGEISQDCGRYRHFNLGELDKDVWRAGGSNEQVLAKWQLLLDLISDRKE